MRSSLGPRRAPIGVLFALGVVAVFACRDSDTDDNQFREDVISCEEAVARLVECCPSLSPGTIACNYYYHRYEGCGDATETRIDPDIDLSQSRCIRAASCETIRDQNLCRYGDPLLDQEGPQPVCR